MHSSHQNGLDADVAYLRMNRVERNPDLWGTKGFEESFVANGKVTKNFDLKRNWFLLREVVSNGNVSRIFVGPEIKRAFCNASTRIDPTLKAEYRTEILRRLRPYPNHDDHFHLRVKCPPNNERCESQVEPPEGSSCDKIDSVSFDEHEL